MIESILKNIAYLYYPKEVCNIEQKDIYQSSVEYNRLLCLCNNFLNFKDCILDYNNLLKEFKKNSKLENMRDVTLAHWQDRAISFEVDYIVGDKLNKFCINISLILPYYNIFVLENQIELNPYKWITLPVRNKNLEEKQYSDLIKITSSMIEKTTAFSKFPEKLSNFIISDLSFNDIRFGSFTLYNAFFLDENKLVI